MKDFIALLRLADNGADEVAWFRVLQLVEGVGPGERAPAIAAMAASGPAPACARRGRLRRRAAGRLAAWPRAREALPARARRRGRRDRRAASRRARSRGPGRAPSGCATCWRR